MFESMKKEGGCVAACKEDSEVIVFVIEQLVRGVISSSADSSLQRLPKSRQTRMNAVQHLPTSESRYLRVFRKICFSFPDFRRVLHYSIRMSLETGDNPVKSLHRIVVQVGHVGLVAWPSGGKIEAIEMYYGGFPSCSDVISKVP